MKNKVEAIIIILLAFAILLVTWVWQREVDALKFQLQQCTNRVGGS